MEYLVNFKHLAFQMLNADLLLQSHLAQYIVPGVPTQED